MTAELECVRVVRVRPDDTIVARVAGDDPPTPDDETILHEMLRAEFPTQRIIVTHGFDLEVLRHEDSPVRTVAGATRSVVHGCPPSGSSMTPCCGKHPLELPMIDRLSVNPDYVTCIGTVRL